MQITYKHVDEITPYTNNPRHNEDAVEIVANSIREFGFKNPIILDDDGEIIAGHTRLLAAKSLGLEEVPCIVASDLTPEQVKAFRLADNKTAEIAGWDFELLEQELAEIDYIDMAEFGFELDEVETIDFDEEEDIPEVPEEPVTQPGDLYRLGEHYLICGDATKAATLKKLIQKETIDLIQTDPPYNAGIVGRTEEELTILNDNMDEQQFIDFIGAAFIHAQEYLKPGGAYYVWHSATKEPSFRAGLGKANLEPRYQLIWVKNTIVMGRGDYHWQHEPCFYGWKEGATHYFTADRTQSTVFREQDPPKLRTMTKEQLIEYAKELEEQLQPTNSTILFYDKPAASREHPTSKPLKMIAQQIINSSRKGERVLDMFAGSGTTLIACERTGRKAYVAELDPAYCDVIVQRWEALTGQSAELLT